MSGGNLTTCDGWFGGREQRRGFLFRSGRKVRATSATIKRRLSLAPHTPIGMCSGERVTARGAVISFHCDSALLTAAKGLRLISLPRPGLG